MKKYRVTYEYRGKVQVDVEAENEKDAESKGLEEADSFISGNLHVYDVTAREIP